MKIVEQFEYGPTGDVVCPVCRCSVILDLPEGGKLVSFLCPVCNTRTALMAFMEQVEAALEANPLLDPGVE